jgi:hypothetical protein
LRLEDKAQYPAADNAAAWFRHCGYRDTAAAVSL